MALIHSQGTSRDRNLASDADGKREPDGVISVPGFHFCFKRLRKRSVRFVYAAQPTSRQVDFRASKWKRAWR